MAKNSSAMTREHTPHVNQTGPKHSTSSGTTRTATIINVLKRRAEAVLDDESLDARSREIIRQGLERNDPWLAELVGHSDAGEIDSAVDETASEITAQTKDDSSIRQRIEALAEIICGGGEECAGALLVLMGLFEDSTQPEVLAHRVKHFAFTRCAELNVFGMVDAQIAAVERELCAK